MNVHLSLIKFITYIDNVGFETLTALGMDSLVCIREQYPSPSVEVIF
jgi:hypothetical protein